MIILICLTPSIIKRETVKNTSKSPQHSDHSTPSCFYTRRKFSPNSLIDPAKWRGISYQFQSNTHNLKKDNTWNKQRRMR